jgi:hypothetical protein
MQQNMPDDRGLFQALIGDGRPFLIFAGLSLILLKISARLEPLITHDRAGFGGSICTTGITVLLCLGRAIEEPLAGLVLCRLGRVFGGDRVHPAVGYNNLLHRAPAILGAIMFIAGLLLCFEPMRSGRMPEHLTSRNRQDWQD